MYCFSRPWPVKEQKLVLSPQETYQFLGRVSSCISWTSVRAECHLLLLFFFTFKTYWGRFISRIRNRGEIRVGNIWMWMNEACIYTDKKYINVYLAKACNSQSYLHPLKLRLMSPEIKVNNKLTYCKGAFPTESTLSPFFLKRRGRDSRPRLD